MAFWGVEIKPGNLYILSPEKRRLRICQATLGGGSSNKSSRVFCNVGDKVPVIICSLLPNKAESIHLELEFEEIEKVTFRVIGDLSVHLTGYVLGTTQKLSVGDDEFESYGEDIRDTATKASDVVGDEDDYGGSFINDDELTHVSPSPASSEEVKGKKKAGKRNGCRKRLIKKNTLSESEDDDANSLINRCSHVDIVDSDEDDHKFISSLFGNVNKDCEASKSLPINPEDVAGEEVSDSQSDDGAVTTKKRNIVVGHLNDDCLSVDKKLRSKKRNDVVQEIDDRLSGDRKRKKKLDTIVGQATDDGLSVVKELRSKKRSDVAGLHSQKLDDVVGRTTDDIQSGDRKLKKKKRKHETNALVENGGTKTDLCTRTISGGLVIEELEIGQQDGKVASSGKKVTVDYTGKLKEQGQDFCSTYGKSPLKFRLGKGVALDGLHLGIDGMRVGGRRRLTIPPELGYGSQGTDGVPPNAWLVMDVELLKVH